MTSSIREWLNLSVRWIHVFAAIMWVGQTFYFTWLDGQFGKLEKKGPVGETASTVWMVHSGGFYTVEKQKSLAVKPDHPVARRVAGQAHSDLLVLARVINEKTGKLFTETRVEEVRQDGQGRSGDARTRPRVDDHAVGARADVRREANEDPVVVGLGIRRL